MRARTKLLKDLISLEGRAALVTGGGGHVGAVICEALAEQGSAVAVLDVAKESCAETAINISKTYGVETLAVVTDLSNELEVVAVSKKILERFGRLDILVNCAALVGTSELEGWAVPFAEQRAAAWRLALEINLTAPFLLVQACTEALAASGKGSVVNISSIYGMVAPDIRLYENTGLNNPAAYAASKGGLLQLTRWLATILAPHVRVNAVSLGGIFRGQPQEFVRRYESRTPLGRMAREEDLKGAVAYLASDLSAYVTGHNLVVDGGWTVW